MKNLANKNIYWDCLLFNTLAKYMSLLETAEKQH